MDYGETRGKRKQKQKNSVPVLSKKTSQEYFEGRLEDVKAGESQYPHFSVSMSIPEFIKRGDCVETSPETSLAGRIMSKRSSSSKLFFYDLHGDGCKVQVMAKADESTLDEAEFSKLHAKVKHGDIVGVIGFPMKTKKGELTLLSRSFTLLSYCLHMIADTSKKTENWSPGQPRNPTSYILKDKEIIYRQRYLDLMINNDAHKILLAKSNITSYIRSYLTKQNFLEVETPVMSMSVGGGAAKPFSVHHGDKTTEMYLRIAPELYLKQLVVGGLGRVFEIGKQFRNEGIDMTHHPEFTSCEFYMAYADYNELMTMTEDLLSGLVKEITGGCKIKYHANGYDKEPIEIDFTPPFRRLDMIDELEKAAQLEIPKDLASKEANTYLIAACARLDVNCASPQTTSRLLGKLVEKYLEEMCVNPTFIIHHPVIMSAFAKSQKHNDGFTERFELYIAKQELCNAYTELNDPVSQRKRFDHQLMERECGDEEAMILDEGCY
ncbi:unnamed protein product [Arabis nemorensis]|uniref:Lysine--tRNA ligase n=1 Tax=Arabis nemorensis TaxID=586526 RepID=A0A565B3J2_9BRAS|nr:unnamed protein product [Arabis nemorensis]